VPQIKSYPKFTPKYYIFAKLFLFAADIVNKTSFIDLRASLFTFFKKYLKGDHSLKTQNENIT